MEVNKITEAIIESAIHVHREIGPGLLESVYEMALWAELQKRGLQAMRQVPVSFEYAGLAFPDAFRIDILVEDLVIVEVKSVEEIAPVHPKQVLTYLRLADKEVGLLLNFGAKTLRAGLKRVVNNYAGRKPSEEEGSIVPQPGTPLIDPPPDLN